MVLVTLLLLLLKLHGLPSAQALLEDKTVAFFSIDTDIIQGLGFKFSEGALRALPFQRPSWLTIQQTEVVEREVHAHRMDPVTKTVKELTSAISSLQRHTRQDFTPVNAQIEGMNPEAVAARNFSNEFKTFVAGLGGSVLPIDGPNLARQMFDRYFQEVAPFEARKKSEFPDAAALLTLENHAVAIVEGCTDGIPDASGKKAPWKIRKEQYLEHLKDATDDVLLVSGSDKLHNARAIVEDLLRIGFAVYDRFTASQEQTLWYYESLAKVLTNASNFSSLSDASFSFTITQSIPAAANTCSRFSARVISSSVRFIA